MEVTSTQSFVEAEGMTDAMRAAFARMFADKDFRALLIHLANRANKSLIDVINNDVDQAKIYATRYQVYNRMYALGQHYFTHFEKLEKDRAAKKVEKK